MTKTALARLALGVFLVCAASTPAQAEYRAEHVLTLAPGGEFVLDASSGQITIHGTDRSDVWVVITSQRDDFEDRFDLEIDEMPGRVSVTTERRGSWTQRWFSRGDRMQFEVEVPFETALTLKTAGGAISVSEIRSDVEARTSGGSIQLVDIDGAANLRTSGGWIDISEVAGTLSARTSGGSIKGERVGGDAEVRTSGGSIDLREMGGEVVARTSGGSVRVEFARGNSRGGSLTTSGGRVAAYVDEGAALDIDASTSGGRVTVDVPVTVQGELSSRSVQGSINGGGATLRLRSSGGGVSVRSL